MVVGASSPTGWAGDEPGSEDAAVFPVRLEGETVGALELVKPSGIPVSTTERNLVNDVAGSVGLVLGYQRLNDSLARRAEELEHSRHRLMEAQDLERRRLERELHDGAQQQLVGLKVKIGIARQLAANEGHSGLVSLLDGLAEEAQLALEEIRSLAKGIYPPVLESDGLVVALSGLAAGAPVSVLVQHDGLGRYPSEVEAAIYFNVSEAVTNAIKHGSPPISIDLIDSDGIIRFEVTDSGSGFNVAEMKPGSGMNNMSDRLDALGGVLSVTSKPGAGTTIRGEVPVSQTVHAV
jgi:signal transduction histidine kinase